MTYQVGNTKDRGRFLRDVSHSESLLGAPQAGGFWRATVHCYVHVRARKLTGAL